MVQGWLTWSKYGILGVIGNYVLTLCDQVNIRSEFNWKRRE